MRLPSSGARATMVPLSCCMWPWKQHLAHHFVNSLPASCCPFSEWTTTFNLTTVGNWALKQQPIGSTQWMDAGERTSSRSLAPVNSRTMSPLVSSLMSHMSTSSPTWPELRRQMIPPDCLWIAFLGSVQTLHQWMDGKWKPASQWTQLSADPSLCQPVLLTRWLWLRWELAGQSSSEHMRVICM